VLLACYLFTISHSSGKGFKTKEEGKVTIKSFFITVDPGNLESNEVVRVRNCYISKIFDPGRVGHFWFGSGFGKFPLKIPNF